MCHPPAVSPSPLAAGLYNHPQAFQPLSGFWNHYLSAWIADTVLQSILSQECSFDGGASVDTQWSARAGSLLAWEAALKVGKCPGWASVQLSKCLSGCRHEESVYTFISGCHCSSLLMSSLPMPSPREYSGGRESSAKEQEPQLSSCNVLLLS